jgi:hypothetical protein
MLLVGDPGLLANPVHCEADRVASALGFNLDLARLAIEHERHRHDGLQRIALGPSVRGDVCLSRGHPDRKVEHPVDGVGGQARPVVGDLDGVRPDRHADLGRYAGVLAGIQCIIDELLEHDQGPDSGLMPGLGHELFRST